MARAESGLLGLPRPVWVAAAALCAVAVTAVSMAPPRGTPGPQIADLGEVVATLGHVAGYLVLGGLVVIALGGRGAWSVWVAVTAFGALLEIVQGVVGLRSFQWSDIVANAAGAALGVGVGAALCRRSRARYRTLPEHRGSPGRGPERRGGAPR